MSCIRSCYDKDSSNFGHDDCPTCIHKDSPPQRTWVGLTNEERLKLYRKFEDFLESDNWEYEKAIEAELMEKNT